jgi:hypothetical protein
VDVRCCAGERCLLWASRTVCFGSTSEAYSALHNKPLTLLWSLVPWILSTKLPNDFVNEFISDNWVSSLSTFFMHITALILEFSAPFSHTTVTHTFSPHTRHNRRWISAALCPSVWRKQITARTSQLVGVALIVSMFHQLLLLHYSVKMHESWCSETTNFACYYWTCDLVLCQRVYFHQTIGAWFWKSPRTIIPRGLKVLTHGQDPQSMSDIGASSCL